MEFVDMNDKDVQEEYKKYRMESDYEQYKADIEKSLKDDEDEIEDELLPPQPRLKRGRHRHK